MEGMKSNAFLETERVGTLMRKYSIPCIISLVVAALYNIVDQIFIANADYLGSYGNAANTVVFPLTVVALAVAVMIGDGCCAFVSISLGAGRNEDAHRSIGSAILLCLGSSAVLTAVYLLCMDMLLMKRFVKCYFELLTHNQSESAKVQSAKGLHFAFSACGFGWLLLLDEVVPLTADTPCA